MGITSSDLLFKYTGSGSAANPELSLGGTISSNTIPSGTDNNLFDDVTGDESYNGAQHYRAIGIHNSHGTHILMNAKVWITGYSRASSNYDVIYFGVERPAGTGGNPDGTIQTIASETVAPTGITWKAEGTPSETLDLSGKNYVGSIGPDDWSAIWLQRSIPAGAEAYNNRSCTIRVQGETSASPYIYRITKDFKVTFGDRGRMSIEEISSEVDVIGSIYD